MLSAIPQSLLYMDGVVSRRYPTYNAFGSRRVHDKPGGKVDSMQVAGGLGIPLLGVLLIGAAARHSVGCTCTMTWARDRYSNAYRGASLGAEEYMALRCTCVLVTS